MTQALQFTPEQVARQLDLSPSVVQRLSHYFEIPQSYYRAQPGQPRILLYRGAEVALLQTIQQRLIQGHALSEMKPMVAKALQDGQTTPEPAAAAPAAHASPLHELPLMEYERDEQLKEQLAEVTFKQYRQTNSPQKAPFKSLMQELGKPPSRRGLAAAREPAPAEAASMGNPMALPEPLVTPPAKAASPWMSPDLKDRAMALQHELMQQLHSNNFA